MAQTRKANVSGEYFVPGHRITGVANQAIVGSRFVVIVTGAGAGSGRGNHPSFQNVATAGGVANGVAEYDVPQYAPVSVLHTGCYDVLAGAALTAGTPVQADATGQAVPQTTGVKLGTATADTPPGQLAPIWLSL